jgi:hypothetical protein
MYIYLTFSKKVTYRTVKHGRLQNLVCNQMQFNHNNLLPCFSSSKPLPPTEIKSKTTSLKCPFSSAKQFNYAAKSAPPYICIAGYARIIFVLKLAQNLGWACYDVYSAAPLLFVVEGKCLRSVWSHFQEISF